MTKYLFFCGKGASESAAVREALKQCSDIILNFPSLVVELVEMVSNASGYDAHVRVMAISDSINTKKNKKKQNPSQSLEIKPNDDLGRRDGVEHGVYASHEERKQITLVSFDMAVTDGIIPDIPTQDLGQFKGLGMSVEQVRFHLNNRRASLQQQLEIDKN